MREQKGFVNGLTSSIYGVSGIDRKAMAAQEVTFDPAQRAGILTQPGFLGSHATHDESSATKRALPIRNRVFCLEPIKPLPNVPTPPELKEIKLEVRTTTRKRFEDFLQANGAGCAGCHASLNPFGNPFESYDELGRYRTMEYGKPVDTTGGIVGTKSSDKNVRNAIEMAEAIAAAPEAQQCFAQQVFQYALGRRAAEHERCALLKVASKDPAKVDVREVLVDVVASRDFVFRRVLGL
jgi:hypothetical protein